MAFDCPAIFNVGGSRSEVVTVFESVSAVATCFLDVSPLFEVLTVLQLGDSKPEVVFPVSLTWFLDG